MAAIKFRWTVNELANVLTKFDVQKVYRSTAGPTGPWNEITTPATRVPLVAGVESYLYDDMAGDASYYYASAYFNTSTLEESNLSDPIRGDLVGYITIEDVRAQGFTDPPYSDAQVIDAIETATAIIDTVTGKWFEPRTRTFKLDGRIDVRGVDLLLKIPIIAATKLTIDDEEQNLEDFIVYNRHLTQGLSNPDDRYNPHIAWDDHYALLPPYPVRIGFGEPFLTGRQLIELEGIFGWTELGASDPVGETTPGSQVPLSYGDTPKLIKRAALMLVADNIEPIADGGTIGPSGPVTKEKTRDQEVTFASGSKTATAAAYSLTGNVRVDAMLMAFQAPLGLGAV